MRRSVWIGTVLLVACAVASIGELCRARAQQQLLSTRTYEDVYYLPPNEYLIVGSLGYRSALADLIWMKALVYFGNELIRNGNVRHLFRYSDAMIALDADFKRVYRWVANGAVYRPGEVTAENVHTAIRYLEVAAKRFPDDGQVAWELGANYMFELAPFLVRGSPEYIATRQKGLEYLEAAALRGAGPPWLVLQTAGQLTALGRNEQAIRHLEDMYEVASDPDVKEQIAHKLTQLRSESYVEAFRRTAQELDAARVRDFPYVDPTLYLLLGSRPPFGGDTWLAQGFDPAAHIATQELSD